MNSKALRHLVDTVDPGPECIDYPRWVCHACGVRYGRLGRQAGVATYHPDTCGVCGQRADVTEPSDYGHLRDGWQQHPQPCDVQGRGD